MGAGTAAPGSVNDLIYAIGRHQRQAGAIAAAELMLKITEPVERRPDDDSEQAEASGSHAAREPPAAPRRHGPECMDFFHSKYLPSGS